MKSSGSLCVNIGDTYFARWSSIRDGGRQGLAELGRKRRKTPLGGIRQEKQLLLIPPYRVISSGLLADACARIFSLPRAPSLVPATLLQSTEGIRRFERSVSAGQRGYVFFQAKLGGEISIPASARSPEISFDATLIEVENERGRFRLRRCGIFEIQTMDFHGSYRKAVNNLAAAARLHGPGFAKALRANPGWAREGIEGPNIANVFKRTFYQAMIKFELASRGRVAGTVLALPRSVWESWQPFLGAPELVRCDDGSFAVAPERGAPLPSSNASIMIFDLDSSVPAAISPVKTVMHVRVDAEQLAHHALRLVPDAIIASLSEEDSILARAHERLARFWPELGAGA